ncbi:hypothetical protein MGG_07558 [Pyricularia oryzae 70-15]|uniref:Secreted protein n=1 Tax=Pyricularia oryzae (strain 70-15 / ATCC MYA-4617 / FGSC 8958) TaxID=242507 RepID=G4N251_PYRO7|nr:uncharacterized protein MGG_07558 [Pyricularia oryzae 70-15]EHA51667.1 hypothetical protein MGG_07558 [Pyricularia oryzae 70-15]
MKSFTAVSVLATALAALAPGASAASCYGSATWGSVQEYQTTASAICRGSESYTGQSDCQRGPVGGQCCTQHEAWFKGTRGRRDYCWDAFNNIIAQCIQKEGRNGGEWTWSSGGLTQNYYLQSNRVCRSKRELQHNAINGVISEGAFNATSDATSVETEESK